MSMPMPCSNRVVNLSAQARSFSSNLDLSKEFAPAMVLDTLGKDLSCQVTTIIADAQDAADKLDILGKMSLVGRSPESDSAGSFALAQAFYHAGALALSRLFAYPGWSYLAPCPRFKPPACLDQSNTGLHAIAVLEAVESRLPFVGLEAIAFPPLLLAVALEVRAPDQRSRVEAAFELILEKGFVVAKTYLSDAKKMWMVVPPLLRQIP
ncbi:hypothetical protein BKA67DRAFT_254446 [Truncatella angustata]|uniref:Uncharacterized protein n=1 Tax=Truncatella angustata TaxID=152316 RepID=A0A9P9A0E6_9PEZI|nr:uncharacterized protein BKA67DRAFT_254446 [Truncatella angustata]KAH6656035.1 hypothetical protein BKA67DRAFT_254446 [Truncatella angustata]